MKKNVKGFMAGMLSMSMVLTAPLSVFAAPQGRTYAAAYTAEAKLAKPDKPAEGQKTQKGKEIGKVTCTSSGKVNISFKGEVTYTDALRAVIKDAAGQEISCTVVKKNKGMMSVMAAGLVKDLVYTITIDGILGEDSKEPVTIEKAFTAKGMKTKCKVGSASVQGKKFVILKMKSAASYKDAAVSVKDFDGNECEAKIVKKAKGNIKIQISGMKKGSTYTIIVNGVKTKKEKSYGSVTKTITIK